MDRDWLRFMAWRHRHALIGFASVLVLLAAIGGTVWATIAAQRYKPFRGGFPPLEAVERECRVWEIAQRKGILRGRPLIEHRFAKDASKAEDYGAAFSLWTTKEGRVVGFSSVMVECTSDERMLGLLLGHYQHRDMSGCDFLDRYVGNFPFSGLSWREEVGSFSKVPPARAWLTLNGFSIDMNRKGADDPNEIPCYLVVVKSRDW